jgi:hypothetical protein
MGLLIFRPDGAGNALLDDVEHLVMETPPQTKRAALQKQPFFSILEVLLKIETSH